MQHNVDTIIRKIKMNAQIIPAEIILLIRDMLVRLEKLEVGDHGVETSIEGGSRPSKVSKNKVSGPKVHPERNK